MRAFSHILYNIQTKQLSIIVKTTHHPFIGWMIDLFYTSAMRVERRNG